MSNFSVQPSFFVSKGVRCRGDLYLPDGRSTPPVIVMAHGFGAERSFGLPPFAERFATAGMAVFLFDYRSFSDSEGEPRNYVDPTRHLQDWAAALAHVRALPNVDRARVALWGYSFSGGHVLVTAARDQRVSAVVAQSPYVDPITTIQKLGLGFLLRGTPHALRDVARMLMGKSPHHIKIVAPPDQFGALNTPECYPGYSAIIPEETTWENKCPARILFSYALYRPASAVSRITCPVLLMPGVDDSLIDIHAVRRVASRVGQSELVEYPVGHFELFQGEWFETAVGAQTTFLKTHLHPVSAG